MTFDEACGIQRTDDLGYYEKTRRYVEYIGRENIRPQLPEPVNILAREYLADQNFNAMPQSKWENAAGYDRYDGRRPNELRRIRSSDRMALLLFSKHITTFSESQVIGLLKRAAEMDVLDWLRGVLGPKLAAGQQFWAVFENRSEFTDGFNRNNVFDYECAAAFESETDAIRFESEAPGKRVRKLVFAPTPKNVRTHA